jgi:uncharacterized protein DUF29
MKPEKRDNATNTANEFGGDYCAWVRRVAHQLQRGPHAGLDFALIAEEFGSLAWLEKERVRHELEGLLMALVEVDTPRTNCYCCRTYRNAAIERRGEVLRAIEDSPSLRDRLPELLDQAWHHTKYATDCLRPELKLPGQCPWTVEQILNEALLPPYAEPV